MVTDGTKPSAVVIFPLGKKIMALMEHKRRGNPASDWVPLNVIAFLDSWGRCLTQQKKGLTLSYVKYDVYVTWWIYVRSNKGTGWSFSPGIFPCKLSHWARYIRDTSGTLTLLIDEWSLLMNVMAPCWFSTLGPTIRLLTITFWCWAVFRKGCCYLIHYSQLFPAHGTTEWMMKQQRRNQMT